MCWFGVIGCVDLLAFIELGGIRRKRHDHRNSRSNLALKVNRRSLPTARHVSGREAILLGPDWFSLRREGKPRANKTSVLLRIIYDIVTIIVPPLPPSPIQNILYIGYMYIYRCTMEVKNHPV